MDHAQSAVFFFEEDDAISPYEKPLMLEAVLFCPILQWASKQLLADGVQRFFVVSSPRFAQAARACFPDDADVIISEQQSDLSAFLNTPDPVLVLPRAALPMKEAGPGFAYQASGYELQEAWQTKMTNNVSAAELVPGWIPIFNTQTIAELELMLRDRIVQGHIRSGVRFLDPKSVYIDPRVAIGPHTTVLPGTLLEGSTTIGQGCTIGPNAVIRGCTIGDGTEVNASQLLDSSVGNDTHIGPFAYVRPGSKIGSDIKVGDFVEVKNSTIGDGTKISHLTYVGDSDVGQHVNFGCGTVTTNYDGFVKNRCTIGDHAFIGCNTNLIAPVTLGEGCYTAAGATVTEDVPADALAVARARQRNIEGWAARNRDLHKDR